MLGGFIHSYEVYKADFRQYFLHCFLSVFITPCLDTVTELRIVCSRSHDSAVRCFICAFTKVRSLF